ncbi:MAG: hypothetical protein ACTHJL_00380 [Amnibacterium sp.]
MRRSIVALAALALLLTGCAEAQPAAPAPTAVTPAPGSSLSPSPSATPSSAAPAPVQLTVRHGKPPAGVQRGPAWTLVASSPGSSSVTIAWSDVPTPGCGEVKEAFLREGSSSVVLDLVHSARKTGVVCPTVLVPRQATVTLSAPLGSRSLQEDATTPGDGLLPCPSASPSSSRPISCPLSPATQG